MLRKSLIFIAIFIVKIDENCYDFLPFLHFLAVVAWKNVVTAVQCLVTTFWLVTLLRSLMWR